MNRPYIEKPSGARKWVLGGSLATIVSVGLLLLVPVACHACEESEARREQAYEEKVTEYQEVCLTGCRELGCGATFLFGHTQAMECRCECPVEAPDGE